MVEFRKLVAALIWLIASVAERFSWFRVTEWLVKKANAMEAETFSKE